MAPGNGQLVTGSFMDYAMPRAEDIPPIRDALYDVPATTNPLGVKGGGKPAPRRRSPASGECDSGRDSERCRRFHGNAGHGAGGFWEACQKAKNWGRMLVPVTDLVGDKLHRASRLGHRLPGDDRGVRLALQFRLAAQPDSRRYRPRIAQQRRPKYKSTNAPDPMETPSETTMSSHKLTLLTSAEAGRTFVRSCRTGAERHRAHRQR